MSLTFGMLYEYYNIHVAYCYCDEPSKQLSRYIILINSDSFDSTAESSALSKLYSDFALLLLVFVLCASQFCSSRESLLSEWTYHVFTPST